MSIGIVLVFGLFFGMLHSLDADHLAAVATLAVRDPDPRRALRQGLFWGIGHALTLLAFGGGVMLLGAALSDATVEALESVVGAMLVLLGLDLLRRMKSERVHFHAHRHAPGETPHLHAHSHRGEADPHDGHRHHHTHGRLPLRALLIGMVHGLAGSAALVLLSLRTVGDPGVGLMYFAVFGLGSLLGMGLFTWAITIPMRWSGARLSARHRAMTGLVAVGSMALGIVTIASHWPH